MSKAMGRRTFETIATILMALSTVSLSPPTAPFHPGQIFVAYDANKIGVFADTVSREGRKVEDVLLSDPPALTSSFGTETGLTGGGGVAMDEKGSLYVTVQNFEGTTNRRGLIKFTRDGTIAWKADSGGTTDYRGLAASEALDRVFVATGSGIHAYRAITGERLDSFGGSLAFRDVALDREGNLYGLRQAGDRQQVVVRRWSAGDHTGTGTVVFVSGATTTAYRNGDPRALVVDEEGLLYITLNSPRVVIAVRPDPTGATSETSDIGAVVAEYKTPTDTGTLIGLGYDPGTRRLFAVHTATGTEIGQFLTISTTAADGETMTAFGPNDLKGARWLDVYPTPKPEEMKSSGERRMNAGIPRRTG